MIYMVTERGFMDLMDESSNVVTYTGTFVASLFEFDFEFTVDVEQKEIEFVWKLLSNRCCGGVC